MTTAASANPDDQHRASNQRNSQQSTGPKTEAGKRVSAQNALKFGFFSTKALLPGESAEEFEEFHNATMRQLVPRTVMEEHIVAQYIPVLWRLRRLPEIEAFVFTRYGISTQGNQCGPGFALVASVQSDNILGQLARYEATLRRSAFKYLELLRDLRKGGSQKEEKPVIEAETVASQNAPPISPRPSAEVEPEAPPTDQPESVPAEGRAIMPPESGSSQDRAPAHAGDNFFKTNPKSEVEPKILEEKHHEQSNGSSDAR